jgi:hypothetical protein
MPAFWSASGMETGLYLLLVCLATLAYLNFLQERTYLLATISAFWFVFVALTRPEGVIFFGAALIAQALCLIRDKQRPDKVFYAWCAICLAGIAVFLAWRFSYFGQWLPNTFYAKAGGGAAKYSEGVRYLLLEGPKLFWGNPLLILLFVFPFLDIKNVRPGLLFIGLCVFAQGAFAVYAGGDWMPGARFFVPVMPAVALLLPAAIGDFQSRLGTGLKDSAKAVLIGLGACCALLYLYDAKQVRHDLSGFSGIQAETYFKPDHFAVANWLSENSTSRTDVVALGEAGLIPYLTDLPAIDLFGLMDPHLARLPGLRHKKFDADYVFNKTPEFIVLGGCRIWSDRITSDFEYARQMLLDTRLADRYDQAFTYHTFIVYKKK